MDQPHPFILTLAIDEAAAAFFNRLRQQYFPADRNFLEAHLTLFHHLPLPAAALLEQLQPFARRTTPFVLEATKLVSLGKGVAYQLVAADLQQLHKQLQQLWQPLLKPQDLQKKWPHITIQNKVSPQQARETLAMLQKDFQPFRLMGTGLSLWEYLDGPWRFVETVPFATGNLP